MYFTRDPVIETIITAKDGHKLVLRNTKIAAQEPFVVDSVEVVSLSGGCFFRSSERSQPFFIPISDYDVVEVRDAKTTLKLPGVEKGIKIAGGRGNNLNLKSMKEIKNSSNDSVEEKGCVEANVQEVETKPHREEKDNWKKGKRRKNLSNKETLSANFSKEVSFSDAKINCAEDPSHMQVASEDVDNKTKRFALLPPPPMLISEVMSKFSEASENKQTDKITIEDIPCIVD